MDRCPGQHLHSHRERRRRHRGRRLVGGERDARRRSFARWHVLQIAGTGFDSTTTVAIDGAAVASVRFINSQQLEATLGGATETHRQTFPPRQLQRPNAGLLLRISQRSQRAARGFHRARRDSSPGAAQRVFQRRHRLQPSRTSGLASQPRAAQSEPDAGHGRFSCPNADLLTADSFAIPPGALYFCTPGEGSADHRLRAHPHGGSAPDRQVQVYPATTSVSVFTPAAAGGPPLPLQMDLSQLSQDRRSWSWQIGTPAPRRQTSRSEEISASRFRVSAAPWLSVTPTQGTAPATLSLKPNPGATGAGRLHRNRLGDHPSCPPGFRRTL